MEQINQYLPLVGIAGGILVFWRMGGNNASSQVINTYKEQVGQLQEAVTTLTAQLGEVNGKLKEKEDRIKNLESILPGSPDQQRYQDEMRAFTKGVAEYMSTTTKVLGEISIFMQGINQHDK